MTSSLSPPLPPDQACAVCLTPIRSGSFIQTEGGQVMHIRCRREDSPPQLTHAWGPELRRAMRCAACYDSLEATEATVRVSYVPAGEFRGGRLARVHLGCLVRWLTGCLRSDPGRDAFLG
jgi:hypothetical protein